MKDFEEQVEAYENIINDHGLQFLWNVDELDTDAVAQALRNLADEYEGMGDEDDDDA